MNNDKKYIKTSPLISICCVSYNHEEFCKKAVESILNQDYQNIEIIIVDDGSSDETLNILSDIKKHSQKPLKILSQANTGNVPANFNKAIRNSSGELLMFLSLDDELKPKSLDLLVKNLLSSKDYQLVIPKNIEIIDKNGGYVDTEQTNLFKRNLKCFKNQDFLDADNKDAGSFYIQGCIFKKSLIENCGSFDEDMLGDDIVLRIKIFRYMIQNPKMKFKLIENATCRYRKHDNNIHLRKNRQCDTIYQVSQRYFDGKLPKILNRWIDDTVRDLIEKNNLKLALRIILLDKKNKKKLKLAIKYLPTILKKLLTQIRQ